MSKVPVQRLLIAPYNKLMNEKILEVVLNLDIEGDSDVAKKALPSPTCARFLNLKKLPKFNREQGQYFWQEFISLVFLIDLYEMNFLPIKMYVLSGTSFYNLSLFSPSHLSINGVSPRVRKILQLLRLRQIHNGTFIRLNKATIQMLRLVEPYIAWG